MTTSTTSRVRQWIAFWRSAGEPDDKGPRRPRDVNEYHDDQLRRVAKILAAGG